MCRQRSDCVLYGLPYTSGNLIEPLSAFPVRFPCLMICIADVRPDYVRSKVGLEIYSVLALSLLIDGYVLVKTVQGIWESKPRDVAFAKHLKTASGSGHNPCVVCCLRCASTVAVKHHGKATRGRGNPPIYNRIHVLETNPLKLKLLIFAGRKGLWLLTVNSCCCVTTVELEREIAQMVPYRVVAGSSSGLCLAVWQSVRAILYFQGRRKRFFCCSPRRCA